MNAEAELVKAEPMQVVRQAGRTMITREQLAAEVEQRRLLGEYVERCMKEGTDYGKIPGTDKPTLLKPGAEKLMALFYCSPEFTLVPEFSREDFKEGFFKYTFRCRVLGQHGGVVAEGYGSANSREARYRWRDGKRKCPNCNAETLFKSKDKPEFFCWGKKGGCGKTYGDKDPLITGQQVGRVENPDIADLDNTVLKMAKKRALVDGAIALARCSDMFTQDVEDMPPPEDHRAPEPPRRDEPLTKEAKRAEEPPPPSEEPRVPYNPNAGFGPCKGKPIVEMTDAELRASIDLGRAKLTEQPKAKWARAMRANVQEMEIQLGMRVPEPETEQPVAVLTVEEAERAHKTLRANTRVGFGSYSGKFIQDLADDEVGLAGEELTRLLEGAEGKRWSKDKRQDAANRSLLLGLELTFRMENSAKQERAEAKRNLEG